MTTEADAFLMGAGGRSAVFRKHGDQVWGEVVSAVVRQQTDFESGALLYWDDGRPRNQLVVTLDTTQNDGFTPEDEDDDGLRRVYVRGQMQKAVSTAVAKAKERGLRPGGRLFVRYTGDAEPTRKGLSGAKQYFARYQPPAVRIPVDEEPHDNGAEPDIEPSDVPF